MKKNSKIKTVIIVYDYAFINGGAAKVAIQSAIGLSKVDGLEVYYFAAVGPVCEELKNSNVKTICMNLGDINDSNRIKAMMYGIWNRRAEKEFYNFLDKFNVESTIVHIHGWAKALSSSVIRSTKRRKIKCFITLHDYFSCCPNGGFYNYRKRKICSFKPMSLRCIFCNCDKRNFAQKVWRVIRQFIQDFNVRHNFKLNYISISDINESVVKKYVDSTRFYRVNNPIEISHKKITDIQHSKCFLYVGRLSEEKGIDLFCRAIEIIKKDNKDVEGIVVGDGVLLEKLKEQFHNVQFVGWKTSLQVQEYMNNARCLVFPSKWYEGAPLTIMEAMSAALPCIVSDCTSAVEVIDDCVNGCIFKTDDLDSLIEKIRFILYDENLISLHNCLKDKFLCDNHNMKSHIEKLIEVYESV